MQVSDNSPDFRVLFESAPGLYLVLSPDLKIVAASNAYLEATMTKRESILGKKIFDIFPDNPDDPTASGVGNLGESLNRVLQTKSADTMAVQKYDIPRPASQGGGFEEKYWSPLNTPVLKEDSGEVVYIIHRVEDVTEFIRIKNEGSEKNKIAEELKSKANRMEAEIFRRAQEIQETNKKLRDAEKLKSEFFANVSHELRTPLSLILAPLESVLSGKYGVISNDQGKLLQTIHNNAIRLLQLVNGLLDFSKFEAGKMTAHRESTDIARLLRTILNDFESMMRGKKINLSYDIGFDGIYAMMDRYLLERIIFNLLSNAAKFTPDGGQVFVRSNIKGNRLFISVEDTGIGIPETEIKNLFKKFNQIEGSSIRRFEGTGLGLAMVKEFAELLDGSVAVKSAEGKGSTFEVNCLAPLTEIAPSKDQSISEKRKLVPQYNVVPDDGRLVRNKAEVMKVLVCEDNQELCQYIVSLLQGICEVRTASNGDQALEVVKSWMPDLVLSDVMMPKKDGIAVCSDIKSNPETSRITVVLLTALTHREAMLKGWEAKADEYLFKPFHPEELVTRINSLLNNINDRKKADHLINQKNKELAQANADLESFSYSVSHDLRAPLRSITGYSSMLEEDLGEDLSSESKRILSVIKQNTVKMNKLIDDLLIFSKLGTKDVNKSEVRTPELVKSIVGELNGSVKGEITFNFESLSPVWADQALLAQVWINLLSNAIKYSAKKDHPRIEIGSRQTNGEVVYYVKDNGVGFDMAYGNKLFGVFQRLHKPTDFEGTGIGLALVKRIITKHGGRVWAEGKANEGATFFFSIPSKM